MPERPTLVEGHVLTGPLFNEPMRVVPVRPQGDDTWDVGLVGLKSERFRPVTLTSGDLKGLTILEAGSTYDGDPTLLRLGLQAYALGIAYEFDPYFGLSISRVDPLPHQLEAVYDYLLKVARVRFLLADDAGAGKTIMAGLLIFNYDIPWNPNRLEQRMGRTHRYGQRKDCLIFNFVATNTIEGRVLQRLLEKLQEIRDALDDDAVFNVVGEILPAAHVERVLRDYYAGRLGDADLEERLLRNVDEGQFRAIRQNALEGLASKKLNLCSRRSDATPTHRRSTC